MTPPNLYLATSDELPDGDPDTAYLAAHLRSVGLSVEVVVWSDPAVDWSMVPLTLIRSTWDYHTRHDDFLRWARRVPGLQNPAPVVEWNTDKRYLLDLAASVPVVASHVIADPTEDTLTMALDELGWNDAVLKPAVGLDGHGVTRIGRGVTEHPARTGAWMLQPFMAQAMTEGETSVVVIDGRATHAVRRLPPPGDFRAQERLGGRVEPVPMSDEVVELALATVACVEPSPLYARVDVVRQGETPYVMELELVEPSLFFQHGPAALTGMSDAIRRLCAT